ncbi:MAG: septum formation initiator family protein [Alphaproteobacteria bacterium]|nr:septum formation initiator family protein [Alphaproteobacteria bacterium]
MRIELPSIRLFPLICLVIAAYFIYHGIYGARGYKRIRQVNQEIVAARHVADDVHRRRMALEVKVKALSLNALDMDQLEESALQMLNMGHRNDLILLPEK